MERYVSGLGYLVMLALAWLWSSHRRRINWRIVAGGSLLQFGIAWLLIGSTDGQPEGQSRLAFVGLLSNQLLDHVDYASQFVFGRDFREHFFAFKVLPTIIFVSALTAALFHLGLIQRVVQALGWVMQRTLGTSGAESLSAAANIFVGQTEAPLVIRHYLANMTESELMAVMVGGYATVAGGVMAAYISMGIDAGHLVTASIISAPAALLIAKLMEPEVGSPETLGKIHVEFERTTVNLLDALAVGAAEGAKLALNILAMLIAFLALISLTESLLGWLGNQFGQHWTLAAGLGYLFAPLAWLMGVERADVLSVGQLLGLRTAANEFIAYEKLAEWLKPDSQVHLSRRSQLIATYALCGFANLGSIGVQIGGLGTLVPSRRQDIARLGLRAMWGGMLACFMTACIAGILL
jgi:CNT family concentrative nucleoside transporter